jgi:2-polyprenyl-3-methyl-5-hydroxy-6-metoxy-1,4-benzoquinol methylase
MGTRNTQHSSGDKASPEFWDHWWKRSRLPAPIDPLRPGLKNYLFRRFHQYFQRLFEGYDTSSMKLIEVGCAQSVYLPYFAQHFGFEVSGIDRSELGCQGARALLEREGVKGQVYCADFFSVPEHLMRRFDIVISFGVVEHFQPTSEAVRAMAGLLKSEGRMITSVPNLTGVVGAYQKLLDRDIYSVHVPLGRESLATAHKEAGLEIESCEYFLPICLEVLNAESLPKPLPYWFIIRSHGAISRAVWFVDEHLFPIPPSRWTSPYVNCVARMPLGRR